MQEVATILDNADTETFPSLQKSLLDSSGRPHGRQSTPDKALLFLAVDIFSSWNGQPLSFSRLRATHLAKPKVIVEGHSEVWVYGQIRDILGSCAPVVSHRGPRVPRLPLPLSA